jgi:hypothetical protein
MGVAVREALFEHKSRRSSFHAIPATDTLTWHAETVRNSGFAKAVSAPPHMQLEP